MPIAWPVLTALISAIKAIVPVALLFARAPLAHPRMAAQYAPELNDIDVVWHDLKARHLAHQTFTDTEALDRAIHAAVTTLNTERNVNPLVKQRISLSRFHLAGQRMLAVILCSH
jgi:hypothetical protein